MSSSFIKTLSSDFIGQIKETHNYSRCHIQSKYADVYEEVSMVPSSYAIVYPLTVMVKSIYTFVANVTVARFFVAEDLTGRA